MSQNTLFRGMEFFILFVFVPFYIFGLHRGGIPRDQSVLSNLAQMFPDEDDIDTPR